MSTKLQNDILIDSTKNAFDITNPPVAGFAYISADIDGTGDSVFGGATFTQTYATTTATVPTVTYSVYTVTAVATVVVKTNTSPYGFSTGDADKVVTWVSAVPTDLAGIQVEVAANAADNLADRKLINALINACRANGIAT